MGCTCVFRLGVCGLVSVCCGGLWRQEPAELYGALQCEQGRVGARGLHAALPQCPGSHCLPGTHLRPGSVSSRPSHCVSIDLASPSAFSQWNVCVCVCLGGFNQAGFLSSVECYCPDTNEWTYVTDMPLGRSGMGIVVTMEPCPGNLPEEEDEEVT